MGVSSLSDDDKEKVAEKPLGRDISQRMTIGEFKKRGCGLSDEHCNK